LAASFGAFGQALPTVTYGIGGGTLKPASFGTVGTGFRTWAANSGGVVGDVLTKDAITARVGGAANAAMYAQRTFAWTSVATAAARALPYVAVASAIYAAYDSLRCRNTSSGAKCDSGESQQMVSSYSATYQGFNGAGATPRGAVMDAMGKYDASQTGSNSSYSYSTVSTYVSTSGNNVTVSVEETITYTGQQPQVTTTTRVIGSTPTNALQCTHGGSLGRDGLCPRGEFVDKAEAISEADLATKQATYGDKALAPQILQEALPWVDISPYAMPIPATGPALVTGPARSITNQPATGPATVTTEVPKWDLTYSPDAYTETPSVVVTNPDGSTVTTTGAARDDKPTCGLPSTAPCKIDETGTKTAADNTAAEAALAAKQTELTTKITDSANRTTLPTSWGWSVPIGTCSSFHFDTNRLGAFEVNPCNKAGVTLWRSLLAWLLGCMTLLYIWRSGVALRG
jgi:hypothetical protein